MTNYIWNIFKKNLIIIYFKCISFRWWCYILFKIKMDLFIHSWNLCRSKLNSIYINLFAIAYNFRRIIYKMWVNFSRIYQKFYLLFNDSLFFILILNLCFLLFIPLTSGEFCSLVYLLFVALFLIFFAAEIKSDLKSDLLW